VKNKLYFNIALREKVSTAFDNIKNETKEVGYYNLPTQDISSILEYCKSISSVVEHIAVIGIGGSSLGAKAVYEFLKPVEKLTRKLYFFESTDPINIKNTLDAINLEKTHFLVISKSGTTVETFCGRFSVLSVVGLIPLALCGVDIKSLLGGAESMNKSFFEEGYLQDILLKKSLFYARNHAKYHINCIFAYSESLKYFCEWYVQLWGESLGKKQLGSAFNVGLTPIGLIGPKDQHSFLQLIMEGTRDKSVTFIKVEDFEEDICIIPDITLPYLEELDTLNNLSFEKLINMQCDSVIEALEKEGDIPLDSISIPKMDAQNIGALIYYYELLTSLVGQLINVNTYDQPGVEAAKIILKEKLKKRI